MSWADQLEYLRKRDFKDATAEERDRAARDAVNLAGYACAAVSVSPLPFSDALLLLPIQSGMVAVVGHIYGRELCKEDATRLAMELGAVVSVGMIARQGIKMFLPIYGALLTLPVAFGATWAMGRAAIDYFKDQGGQKT